MYENGQHDRLEVMDLLKAAGAETLGKDSSAEARRAVLDRVQESLNGTSDLTRAQARNELVKRFHLPANEVDAALRSLPRRESREVEEYVVDPDDLLAAGREILEAEDQLRLFRESVRRIGHAGSTAAAETLHVALNSRSLDRPINVGVYGPSAGGKTFTVEVVLQHHPEDAVHDLTASSERALAYSDFKSEHGYVLISEASALHRDGVGATIIRGLAWGDGIRYETVEKSPEVGLQTRIIEKPGPTGLITTSTKPLDPEISTRLLQVHITDSPGQTQAIVEVLGNEAAGGREPNVDLTAWLAASKWLEVAGNRETVVPFAPQLAKCVPYDDVRMRRDFQQILTVIRALAFMHQRSRERDERGRIIASERDYANAYRLLAKVLAVTLDTVTDEMRETVAAVETLTAMQAMGISVTQLGDALGMSKSGASRRAKALLREGYLVNPEVRQGYPARLKVGDPLPADRPVLPTLEELFPDTPSKTTQRRNDEAEEPETARKTGVAHTVASAEALRQHPEAVNGPRNSHFPQNHAEYSGGVEALRASGGDSERWLLNADADRTWDAAWELDELLGNSHATIYVGDRLREMGGEPDPATVAALADKLETRLRQEQAP